MKKKLFLLSLISFALFSTGATVVLPDSTGEYHVAGFLPSALEELKEQGKFVLFDEKGIPYGFVENGEFKDSIEYGGLKLFPPEGEEGVIVGSGSISEASKEVASMRFDRGMDVDWNLLREQDFTRYAYYSQRYGSLGKFLEEGMGINTRAEALELLKGLQPSEANELLDIFRALEENQVGYSHYKELLDHYEKNFGDLSKQLDPGTLSKLNEFMNEVRKEAAEQLLREALKNIGPEELKLLYELLKGMDYGTLYELARDYTRELARDGTLDEIGKALKESGVGKEILDEFSRATGEMLRTHIWELLPRDFTYYLLGAALIVGVWSLRKVGG